METAPCCGEATGWACPRENITDPGLCGRKGQREEAVRKLRQPQPNKKLNYRKTCRKGTGWRREQLEPETSQKARSQRAEEGKRTPEGSQGWD